MTFAWWTIDAGAEVPEHEHPHEQVVNMLEGELALTVDGTEHAPASGRRRGDPRRRRGTPPARSRACRVLDVFSPVRDDYRFAGHAAADALTAPLTAALTAVTRQGVRADADPAYRQDPARGPAPLAEARLDWLRLARSRRVGPATFIRLIREYGSAGAALDALPRIAAEAGVARLRRGVARRGRRPNGEPAEAAGAAPLLLGAPDYPPLLATIADPPPLLWALGDPGLAARPAVALVGARNASALGCRMASRLAAELGGAGFVVASGLARGIDAAAHRAALATGTIAAQAGGVDEVYPPENAGLAAEIAAPGPAPLRDADGPRPARRRTSRAATASSRASRSASSSSRAPSARAA